MTGAAKIESDRKRKKASTSAAEKENRNKHKKSKMSSSSSKGGGGIEVRASHILIKHEGSRRKASWKDPEGRIIKSTTRENAVSQLKALRDDIVSGKATFEDIASRFSDCSSAKRGGDLGQSKNECLFFIYKKIATLKGLIVYRFGCMVF